MDRNLVQTAIAIVLAAAASACAHVPNANDWARELAVTPGSTLPQAGQPQPQVITLFEVSQQRAVGRQFFIAGVGYVAYNGGGKTLVEKISGCKRVARR